MKSVMFSEVVRSNPGGAWLRGLSPLTAYALTVAVGMPFLVLALHLLDPEAPLALIVLPVLAGLVLPLCASAPGRLDVNTRFDACHMSMTLDATLAKLGYARTEAAPGRLRYIRTAGLSWRARAQTINVKVHAHALEVIGPIPILRSLQRALAS